MMTFLSSSSIFRSWCPCLRCCSCSCCSKLISFLRLVISVHVSFLFLSVVRYQLTCLMPTVLLHSCRASLFCSLSLIIVLFISISRLILILYYHLVTLLTIVLVSRLRPLVREEERERNIYVYMCMKKKLKINLNWFFDRQNWRETAKSYRSYGWERIVFNTPSVPGSSYKMSHAWEYR